MLKPLLAPDPVDGYVNVAGSRRLIRAMSRIDEQLMNARTMLLQAKIKLGLIVNAPDSPVRQQYLPGEALPSGSFLPAAT